MIFKDIQYCYLILVIQAYLLYLYSLSSNTISSSTMVLVSIYHALQLAMVAILGFIRMFISILINWNSKSSKWSITYGVYQQEYSRCQCYQGLLLRSLKLSRQTTVCIHGTIRMAFIYTDNLEVQMLTAVMEATRSSAD